MPGTDSVTLNDGAVTVIVSGELAETWKFASPPYIATTALGPAGNVVTESVATPLALSGPVPRTVAPSVKVTDPVGSPDVAEVTVAVSRTAALRLAPWRKERRPAQSLLSAQA